MKQKLFKITQGNDVKYVAASTMELAVHWCGFGKPDSCIEIADSEAHLNKKLLIIVKE